MRRIVLSFTCFLAVGFTAALLAQPINDDCGGALAIELGVDEGSAVPVVGDTRGGTGSTVPVNVCSGTWFQDDIWFTVTMPVNIPDDGITIKTYFGSEADDVPAVGMAFYPSCDEDATPFQCFSSDVPTDNSMDISAFCLVPEQTYYVRVWSGGSPIDFAGTFRIAAYNNTESNNVLWRETFAGGMEANGWTTFGTCANPDSNENAVWEYLPEGLVDRGAYIFAGAAISSPTLCDGAVGVDSDYNDNFGIEGNFGAGPCPVGDAQYNLISPAIYTGDWDVPGLSILWTQAIRQFQSDYFLSYRTRDGGGADWSDWVNIQINQEFETNGAFVSNNMQRLFLGGALAGDSVQIRFVYNANYYMWAIDDILLVETEAHNMRAMDNWYAIAPNVITPMGQHIMWYGMSDILNAGAEPQTNVNLNLTIVDDADASVIHNDDLGYGTIAPDSLAENENMPTPVNIPQDVLTTYTGTYTVSSDSATMDNDFNFADNQTMFNFATSQYTFAKETGFTTAYAFANSLYNAGAPHSYVWGNYYYVVDASGPNGGVLAVDTIYWGISNPDGVPGWTTNVILFQWSDVNGNEVAEAIERQLLGFGSYTWAGDEGANAIISTTLENFENPGDPILLEDNTAYLIVVENNAVDETQMFLLCSEQYEYGATFLGLRQANAPVQYYGSVMGISPDGNVQGIDYELRELDVMDNRVHFGDGIAALVRMQLTEITATNDLSENNLIDIYPNPAQDKLNLSVELEKSYDEIQINIVGVDGKTVMSETLNNVQKNTYHFDIRNLNSGSYMLHLLTEDGQRTTRFVVQK